MRDSLVFAAFGLPPDARDWCLPPSTGHDLEASLGLRSSFAKEPSGWFEGMDMISATPSPFGNSPPPTELVSGTSIRRIDFWQNSRR